jgi:hypothetical protein
MQTKKELEDWYSVKDRWNYFNSQEDRDRLHNILGLLTEKYENALDVGCGECFITRHLPANNIYGIELSDIAASRFPENVKRVHKPEKNYDLVVSTGTMYSQYDHEAIHKNIIKNATKHILISGIKEWILPKDFGKLIKQIEFPYFTYTQIASLYSI